MNSHHAVTFPTTSSTPRRRQRRRLTTSYVWAFFGAMIALVVAFFASPVHAQRDASASLAQYARALTQAQAGDHDGALEAYDELASTLTGSASADVYAASAMSRRALGDLPGARSDAESASNLSTSPRYQALSAELAMEAGAFTDAELSYELALQADATYAPALSGLAELYNRLARYDVAARTLARLPNPTDDDLTRTLDLAERAGDMGLAAQVLDRLLVLRPYDSGLWVRKGQSLARQDDELAQDAFARALALDPDNREARAALSATTMETSSSLLPSTPARQAAWSGALDAAALQAEADANARDADAWGVAAMAWMEMGDDARAARALDDGLLFFPGNVRLHLAQAYLAALAGNDPTSALTQAESEADATTSRAVEQAAALIRGDAVETGAALVRAFLVPAQGSALYLRLTNRQ